MSKKILFPTDGSPTARAAGRVAADIAKGEGDSVVVFAVIERPDCEGVEDEQVLAAIVDYMRTVADAAVTDLRETGVVASSEVVQAPSIDLAIMEKARDLDADMIVMGTHGRRGLTRAILGSVADKVMRHSHVPVVLVPLTTGDADD